MATDPTAYMIENVTLPAFFAKVASQTGITPGSAEAATSLRTLSDKVAAAVDLYMKKSAAAQQAGNDALIKAAAAATDEALGKVAQATQQPYTASAADFLTVPGVRDAALAYVQQKAAAEKAAMAGCASPAADAVAAAVKAPDEDEDADKPKTPAAA